MADEDVVWVPVLPSLRGFASELSKGTKAAGEKAGKDAGDGIARGLSGSQAAVDKATTKLAAAQDKVKDAAGKTRVAEEKLNELRAKGNATASQLATAEERLATATRNETRAKSAAESATKDLKSQQDALATSTAHAGDEMDDLGSKSLISGENLKKFGIAAAAGIGAAGAALFKIGSDFTDMTNTIRVGTGASGQALDGLVGVAKNLGNQVPASFEDIGTTVADLNTRLGLTGQPLETLTRQFLELSNMGIDADVNDVAAAFQAFGVEGGDTAGALDELFQVSQATGVSVNELAQNAVKGGPALRQFGFGLGSSAALAGTLDKAGLDATATIGAMTRGLQKFAKDGEDPQKALYGTVVQIEDLIDAGNNAAALDLAGGIFGTRGAAQFVDAVQMGTLSVDDFVSATGATSDTIIGVADETRTFSEQWQMFYNDVLVQLEPVATRVFGVITDAMGWLADNGVPAVKEFGEWVGRNKPLLTDLSIALGVLTGALTAMVVQQRIAAAGGLINFIRTAITSTQAWTVAQTIFNAVMNANPLMLIVTTLGLLVGALVIAYRNSETFRSVVQTAWAAIKDAVSAAWTGVIQPVLNWFVGLVQKTGDVVSWLWHNAVEPAFSAIGQVIDLWWNFYAKPIFNFAVAAIQGLGDIAMWLWQNAISPAFDGIGAVVSFTWNNVISPVFDALRTGVGLVGDAFDAAVGFIGKVWSKIESIAAQPVKFVIESVYNNGIRQAWNKVAGWLGLDELEEFKPDWLGAYASGGVLPGYTPGRDVHSFYSPTGGRLNLSGGESVMRPEWTAAVGADGVANMNRIARTRGAAGVQAYMSEQNLALGGTIDSSLWEAVSRAFPGATLNSAYRPGDSGYHGKAAAIDVGGPMQQVADWAYKTFPNMAQLIWGPGPLLYNVRGNKISDQAQLRNQVYAGDLPGHYDHVHMASDFPVTFDGEMVSDAGGSSGGGFWSMVTGFLRRRVADAFDAIVNPIGSAIPDFGGSAIGQLPRKAFDKVTGSVRDWLLGKADDQEGAGGGNMTAGSGPIVDQVREAMAAYGWDQGDQWAAVDWIISHESSWNPTARNPSSGAFGLAQFLGSTKDQYLPDENPNPRIQGDAMARYIRDRYGDPLAAKRFWQENNWYDQGGLATDTGVMLKKVLDPERVLDPAQTAAFEQLVPWLVDLGGMAAGGFADIPGSAEFAGFLTQLPGQIFEETTRDTADFFGLGKVADLAFSAADSSSVPAPEPPAGTDTEPPAGGGDGRGPLVVIEQLVVDNVQEAANAIGREARRAVRSEVLTDGW